VLGVFVMPFCQKLIARTKGFVRLF